MTAGYSGTPLAQKLGLKPGLRSWREGMPASVAGEIGETGIVLLPAPEAPIDAAHIFVTAYADMETKLAALRPLLAPTGFIWVSWPKKASKVDRHKRGPDPRCDSPRDRSGRREGVCDRRDLVRPQARHPSRPALTENRTNRSDPSTKAIAND